MSGTGSAGRPVSPMMLPFLKPPSSLHSTPVAPSSNSPSLFSATHPAQARSAAAAEGDVAMGNAPSAWPAAEAGGARHLQAAQLCSNGEAIVRLPPHHEAPQRPCTRKRLQTWPQC